MSLIFYLVFSAHVSWLPTDIIRCFKKSQTNTSFDPFYFQVRYTAGPKKGFVIENLEEIQRRTGQLSGVSNVAIPKQNVVVKVAPRPVVKQQQQGKSRNFYIWHNWTWAILEKIYAHYGRT